MGEAELDDGGWVTVLGPTSLDGVVLSRRQRSIVAALVLHRHTGASTEAVIDAVWGERVPGTARQSLQNHVARLRARFGPGVVRTDAAGYHLCRVADVHELERSVRPWIERPASPDAVRVLEASLAAWQGTPYLDLEHHDVEVERARLGELHAQVAEQLVMARLTAGDTARAAVELLALTEADPYRERRWELLMLALQASGRRTEALAAYDRVAARFALDLRTRPSDGLQRLRTRIERDEVIDLTVDGAAAVAAVGSCTRVGGSGGPRRRCSSRSGHRT